MTVIIGENLELYEVPIKRLKGNIYFIDDLREDDELGTIITGSRWAEIQPERFNPIYEWLKYGEYTPRLIGNELEEVNTDAQHATETVRCGTIFTLARQLLLYDLLNLVTRKFAILRNPPLQTLIVIRLVFGEPSSETEAEEEMREFLVKEVTGKFWEYAERQPRNLRSTFEMIPNFHREVLTMMLKELDGKADGEN